MPLLPPDSDRWLDQLECFHSLEKQKDCEIVVGDFEQTGVSEFCIERNIKCVSDLKIMPGYPLLFLLDNFFSLCLKASDNSSEYIIIVPGDVYFTESNIVELVSWAFEQKSAGVVMIRAYNVSIDADLTTGCFQSRKINYPGMHVLIFKKKVFKAMVDEMPQIAFFEFGLERWILKWLFETKHEIFDLSLQSIVLHRKHKQVGIAFGSDLSKEQVARLCNYQLAFSDFITAPTWLGKFKFSQVQTQNGVTMGYYNF